MSKKTSLPPKGKEFINVAVEDHLAEKFKDAADKRLLKQNAFMTMILKDFFSRIEQQEK